MALDACVDQPLKGGNGITLQADYVHYKGGRTFTQAPEQDAWLFEAGFYHWCSRVGPWTPVTGHRISDDWPDESTWLVGLAYWGLGHRVNIKAGGGQLSRTGSPTRTQFVIQGQVFWY